MSSNSSASLQHILISIEEYDRLKNIEKLYQKLHKGIEDKFQIKSKFVNKLNSFLRTIYSFTILNRLLFYFRISFKTGNAKQRYQRRLKR